MSIDYRLLCLLRIKVHIKNQFSAQKGWMHNSYIVDLKIDKWINSNHLVYARIFFYPLQTNFPIKIYSKLKTTIISFSKPDPNYSSPTHVLLVHLRVELKDIYRFSYLSFKFFFSYAVKFSFNNFTLYLVGNNNVKP